ncbi:uncharacterized protein LOC111619749 [Centruroides sculpturatus]|uniref:uncharacterized protein LOC111619749 n=1 Tax=Centruroides sculpturatus TaxID=218467 RepID=UPI000C6E2D12|nr:uncharacterized protein LOC111619749 [Centruroides sculpturatus]
MSNYGIQKEYTNVFSFPKDPIRCKQYIKAIHRKDIEPSTNSAVCIHHFDEQFIIREDSAVRDDGTILTIQHKHPSLKKDAFPTKFPNQPSYLCTILPTKTCNPEERSTELLEREEKKCKKWLSTDKINFKELEKIGRKRIPED